MSTMIDEEVEDILKRLAVTFSGPSGIIAESLLKFIELEQEYERYFIKKFRGHDVLLNSFEGFYIETLKLAAELSGKRPMSDTLKFIIAMHVVSFRRFRASQILYLKGYPFDAVSLLRGLFEIVLELATIGHGDMTVNDIYKTLSGKEIETLSEKQKRNKIRTHTFEVQRKINDKLIGKDSGLTPTTIENIEIWKWLLHNSVHKSFSAIASQCGDWLGGKSDLSLLPDINDKEAAQYINMSRIIAWMLLRTFPLLQSKSEEFGLDWKNKYLVLDDSFRRWDMGLASQLLNSIKEFIEGKLDFNQYFIKQRNAK